MDTTENTYAGYVSDEDIPENEEEEDEPPIDSARKNLDFSAPTPMKERTSTNVDVGQEHMKIYLRIRPFTGTEEEDGENQGCMERDGEHHLVMHAPKDSVTYKNSSHGCGKTTHKFTFSKIFHQDTTQKHFFDETMLGTVKDFVDGQNCLMFTYGVTNAGKTYTIQGNPKDAGILPRALDVLFNSIEGRQWSDCSLKPKLFSDIVKLSDKQVEQEIKIKDKTLAMATQDEPDVTSLLGDDASDISRITNSTVTSDDSVFHSTVKSQESLTSDAMEMQSEGANDDSENVQKLFEEAEQRIREEAAINVETQGQIKFSIWVSFAEVYNEQIFDLLEPLPKKKNARRTVLKLSEDKNGSPYVKGLKTIHVTSADEAYKILTIGKKNLQVACTKLNHSSSRSHCIFSIKVVRVVDKESPNMARVSMLSFCDLAGSERYTKTQSAGERLKEAGNINTSLLTLGRCIAALKFNQNHSVKEQQRIIPFRESKLTRLFQSFFCGKGKASMIVNVNQCASLFDETLHVLKFSAIAKQVVIVQKPPEEVKKPVHRPHRYVSLALSQTPGKMGTRPSISWATPGTMMSAQMQEAMNLPIPEEEGEDLNTSDSEHELLELIDSLKTELLKTKREKLEIEARVREEVCMEMAQQLVEIENTYSERLKENQLLAEEKVEKRIEMYTQSVKKQRKRARIDRFEDEEDEWVSSQLLHAEKVKVDERDHQIRDLCQQLSSSQADLRAVKETLKTVASEKDKLRESCSKLQFELADVKTKEEKVDIREEIGVLEEQKMCLESKLEQAQEQIKELQSKVTTQPTIDLSGDVGQSELLENLTRALQEAKDAAGKKDTEITELNEMLTEAGDTFHQKEEEIQKLKDVITEYEEKIEQQVRAVEELQNTVEESQNAMSTANTKLETRELKIKELEAQLLEAKGTHHGERGARYRDTLGSVVSRTSAVFTEQHSSDSGFDSIPAFSPYKIRNQNVTKSSRTSVNGFEGNGGRVSRYGANGPRVSSISINGAGVSGKGTSGSRVSLFGTKGSKVSGSHVGVGSKVKQSLGLGKENKSLLKKGDVSLSDPRLNLSPVKGRLVAKHTKSSLLRLIRSPKNTLQERCLKKTSPSKRKSQEPILASKPAKKRKSVDGKTRRKSGVVDGKVARRKSGVLGKIYSLRSRTKAK